MSTWTKISLLLIMLFGYIGLVVLIPTQGMVEVQQQTASVSSATDASDGSYITVTYNENINVHTGPSSVYYPTIGQLPPGATARAIGRSPAGEWIQIVFSDAPGGVGWVYAPNVELSPGSHLKIVEPPPTATPIETITLDPTLVAAFQAASTPTRLPTYTAPPPLSIPTYANSTSSLPDRIKSGWFILGLGLIGIVGLFISFARRQ